MRARLAVKRRGSHTHAAVQQVLQCDLDVVWLRDPFPLFAAHPLLAAADVLVQSEGGHGYSARLLLRPPS